MKASDDSWSKKAGMIGASTPPVEVGGIYGKALQESPAVTGSCRHSMYRTESLQAISKPILSKMILSRSLAEASSKKTNGLVTDWCRGLRIQAGLKVTEET